MQREKTKPESARQQQLQETRKATLGSRLLNTLPGAASLMHRAGLTFVGTDSECTDMYLTGDVSLGAWQTSDHN